MGSIACYSFLPENAEREYCLDLPPIPYSTSHFAVDVRSKTFPCVFKSARQVIITFLVSLNSSVIIIIILNGI